MGLMRHIACDDSADRDLARRLYDLLSALTIEETGQKLRVYLDQTRLEDGQRWDSGFMEGLSRSWVFVPIVSVGSVQPMMGLNDGEDWCDNVLLEWTAALELHQRGIVKAVLPVIQGSFFSDAQAAFGGLSGLPVHASAATMEQVVMHLKDITDDGSTDGLRELVQQASGQPEPTIQWGCEQLAEVPGHQGDGERCGHRAQPRPPECRDGRSHGLHRPRSRHRVGVLEAHRHGRRLGRRGWASKPASVVRKQAVGARSARVTAIAGSGRWRGRGR